MESLREEGASAKSKAAAAKKAETAERGEPAAAENMAVKMAAKATVPEMAAAVAANGVIFYDKLL